MASPRRLGPPPDCPDAAEYRPFVSSPLRGRSGSSRSLGGGSPGSLPRSPQFTPSPEAGRFVAEPLGRPRRSSSCPSLVRPAADPPGWDDVRARLQLVWGLVLHRMPAHEVARAHREFMAEWALFATH